MSESQQGIRFLNRKETKEILKRLIEIWDAELDDDIAFCMNDKNRIFVVSRDVDKIDRTKLNLNNVGLYFGEITERGELRLSIEGSMIVGKRAKKHIIDIDMEQTRKWFEGSDIDYKSEDNTFVILRYNDDFLGCGKLVKGKILNYVPKARHVQLM
jgi:NOL1/NOP2/fmu family ribosome biogenesis protein